MVELVEWAAEELGGQATDRAWNRRLANYGCGALIKVDERREGGDARKEGSFPGGIYDVTLTGNWLKRLPAVVEVPYCVRSRVRQAGNGRCFLRTHGQCRWSRTLEDFVLSTPIETC